MLIPLDQIDPPATSLRRVPSPAEDARLLASIRAEGVLAPVLVQPVGNRYRLVAGARRLRCAREAGLTEIPVHVAPALDDAGAIGAAAAENIIRTPLTLVEQWRAFAALEQAGRALPDIAAALGMDERRARRLRRLADLAPELLEAIERHGPPGEGELRTIAQATAKTQRAALKANSTAEFVRWMAVASACATTRAFRVDAIFDTTKARGITWEEDLFAEPGSREQFSTRDVEKFLSAQQQALEDQVRDAQAKKQRVQLAEADFHAIKLPAGWQRDWQGDADKPKRVHTVFTAVAMDGRILRVVARNPKQEAAEAKAREQKARAKAAAAAPEAADDAADTPSDDGDTPPIAADTEPEEAARTPFTKAGQQMLAAAKTEALRARLRNTFHLIAPSTLLAALVLALHAKNVDVRGYQRSDESSRDYDYAFHGGADLVRRLVTPEGHLALPDDITLREIASETLARCLAIDGPDAGNTTYRTTSGYIAEWIGHAIDAADRLPRFDTPDFLATVAGAELKRLAATADLPMQPKKVSELRESLATNLPDWRPDQAQFGAPGPKAKRGEE